MKRRTVSIDEDLHAALKAEASMRKLKRIGDLIEPILLDWLKKDRRPIAGPAVQGERDGEESRPPAASA